jgi:hypothetical protein
MRPFFSAIIRIGLTALLFTSSLSAQYIFGQNKIQYNQFNWHILETEHFDIYYYPEKKELAEIGASYAEETYTYLEAKFNHSVPERVPLIFYATHAHFQETNTIPYMIPEGVGGFFEFLKGRVVVPANGSISEFKHVLRHELVHVFTHSKERQVLKARNQINHPGLPLWFVEGLAEYWSSGWDTQAEMFIRDAALNDYVFPLQRIYQINGSFLMYKEGQAILRYIASHYGENKLLELIENLWVAEQFHKVFQFTLGKSYKEFDKEWTYHLKKSRFPLLEEHDSASMIADQLTHTGINIKPAFYRKDGDPHVVFLSNRTGYSNIYIEPIVKQTKEPRATTLVAGERTKEFESFHLLSSKIDVNTEGTLAFTSKSGEQDILYLYDINSKQVISQHQFPNMVSIYSPTWSPDGRQIAFSGLKFSGKADLYIYDIGEDHLTRLTDDYYDDKEPSWSPDGRYLAFSSDRGEPGQEGFYNLFVYDRNTHQVLPVTYGTFNDAGPTWSPDGRYLTFSSDRNGTSNIWVLQIEPTPDMLASNSLNVLPASWSPVVQQTDSTFLKQVTHLTTGAFDPEWTDDGHLLFTAFENFSYQIHRYEDAKAHIDSLAPKPTEPPHSSVNKWTFERIDGNIAEKAIKYKAQYDLDIAQSQIALDPIFGTAGGAQLVVSDMLGNHQYFFLLFNNAQTRDEFLESFNIAVSRVDLSRRTNFSSGFYHLSGRYYNRYDYWFWERRLGGFGALSYPFSKFRRIEASLNVRYSDKEWFLDDYRRKALLVSNFASYIKDTSLWGPTGPIDGERFNLTLGFTRDVANNHVNFFTGILDVRRYFRISRRITHAVRLWSMVNHGREATPFFMGGSWDLRGYRFRRLAGTKLALISNELRFPFIDQFMINFPFGGMGFSAIRGALFVDMGNAWEDSFDQILGSTGFGIRFRLGGMLVLRLDMGRKFVLDHPDSFYDPNNWDMDNNWFTQFFFGWDF